MAANISKNTWNTNSSIYISREHNYVAKAAKTFFLSYISAREGVQLCSIFMLHNSDKVSNFLSRKNRLRMGNKWCYKNCVAQIVCTIM
jgi:hypothetical protein